jgi:urea transporter
MPLLYALRGIGQIVFQENALTGLLFLLGIALGSPLQALGLLVGAALGTLTATLLRWDKAQIEAGIYGFNPALVGIATLFFFQPSPVIWLLLAVGCVVSAVVTLGMRTYLPFPTYTTPFIVTTWVLFAIGKAIGAEMVDHSAFVPLLANPVNNFTIEAVTHGVGQIMFQGTVWAGIAFLVGIGLSDWRHAAWVLAGSVVGMLVASYHLDVAERALNPETLLEQNQFDNVKLGLYGYNATLVAVALYLWRRSLIAPLLGMILSVPITEMVPRLGIPALTAPFVLAAWIVIGLEALEKTWTQSKAS